MYCAIEDVRDLCRMIEEDVMDDAQVERFIKHAQARVDQKISCLYKTPLSVPVPAIICTTTALLASSFLLDKQYSNLRDNEQLPLSKVYNDRAEAYLEDVIENRSLNCTLAQTKKVNTSAILTTTPNRSPLESVIDKWE